MSEPSETARPSTTEPPATNVSQALDAVRTIAAQVLIISDAQFAIWKMQATRVVALALLAIPFAVGFVVFSIYGVVLLDQAASAALKTAPYPEWFSPLVRGGTYTFITLIVMFVIWRQAIGSGAPKKKK